MLAPVGCAPPNPAAQVAPPACVLDTQVLLDWLVFDDPRMRGWSRAITTGRLHWLSCAAMQAEALRVAHDPAIARRASPAPMESLLREVFATYARTVPPPVPSSRLRCRDKDDQMFIDLALAQSARWLLSRDHALLDLRRRAAAVGLYIVAPGDAIPP